MSKEEPIISVDNLTFKYPGNEVDELPEKTVLDNVSLKVNKGEFVGIIGHNGSGKSTLAKLLNAILIPTEGTITIKDMDTKDPDKTWDIRQTAGMVFQNPDNQLVATIVEDDVAFGPENLGVPPDEIRRRVDNCLEVVGMSDFKRAEPNNLSGGQKQRVAIAGILAMEPECIILDEPTAMLDPNGRKEVIKTIRKLNEEKDMTILHITHYMDELINADRIIVLDNGKIVLEGKPKEIFSHVKELKEIGLDVPVMTALTHELNEMGFDLPENLLSIEETAEALCQLK